MPAVKAAMEVLKCCMAAMMYSAILLVAISPHSAKHATIKTFMVDQNTKFFVCLINVSLRSVGFLHAVVTVVARR